MRIGIRAHDVKYAPLDELIPNIHNQGFHCMHIALSKSIKEFKPEISTMTPGLAMYIKELCAENKVDVAVLGCYLNLCNPNPEQHKKIVEKYKAHIRFASIVELLEQRLVPLTKNTSTNRQIILRKHLRHL